jgi:hypothetical protein
LRRQLGLAPDRSEGRCRRSVAQSYVHDGESMKRFQGGVLWYPAGWYARAGSDAAPSGMSVMLTGGPLDNHSAYLPGVYIWVSERRQRLWVAVGDERGPDVPLGGVLRGAYRCVERNRFEWRETVRRVIAA